MTEEKVYNLMVELLKRPEIMPDHVPDIVERLVEVCEKHNVVAIKPRQTVKRTIQRTSRKERKRNPLGWPQGVTRHEFSEWKQNQLARGYKGNLNPHYYKMLRDSGKINQKPRVKATELVASR